ncbi:MAG: FMN-binding glutamate synthase family protein [Planctomycetaceae bacterium]|nr:FMN-binding glutamate synthase family protein [Planctomycetaceae bacterium]
MWFWISIGVAAALLLLVLFDLLQKKHAILRNFPVIGHFRYLLEAIGPELRQYIVTDNDEERPFSRDERRWVYSSSKRANNYFGFGTDNDMEMSGNYLIIKHSAFPLLTPHAGDENYDPSYQLPCAKIIGGHRGRKRAFRPDSVVNISGMSFGSLSAQAIEALNRGCQIAGCLQNTGEGGVSPYHLHDGGLIWQIGTGYFGCRDQDGRFSLEQLAETVSKYPTVKMIEIKLSQGAKPGAGGILPRKKITAEIAAIRGIPRDRDCVSPAAHAAFHDADSLLDFVETIAEKTGLPVGIKSAVGQIGFWEDLARLMEANNRGVDFIAIDGGEGGTGAGPLTFTDHVALPFLKGFGRVQRVFAERGVDQNVVLMGAGKLGFPEKALQSIAMGCDLIMVAREALLSIGCIQAQRCHVNHCPTGVATQNRWLTRGLDPTLKSTRLANYVITLRKELLALSRACGVPHPSLLRPDDVEVLDDRFGSVTVADLFGFPSGTPVLADEHAVKIREIMENSIQPVSHATV